jgi:hypothetical protein
VLTANPRRRSALLGEARDGLDILAMPLVQHLHRDALPVTDVARLDDDAHPAPTDQPRDLVAPAQQIADAHLHWL